jgi:uncharacterized protein
MNCSYCYSPPIDGNNMSYETSKSTIDFIAKNYPQNSGIIFFGGEPLLKKELIIETIKYGQSVNPYFNYKVTTNGLLLDEDFMQYANAVKLDISLSLDGVEQSHNKHRVLKNGKGSFDLVYPKIDLLLKHQPYAKVLMTVSPDTVEYYSKSFNFLIEKGVKYIIVSLDYSANWNDSNIKELKTQYKLIMRIKS